MAEGQFNDARKEGNRFAKKYTANARALEVMTKPDAMKAGIKVTPHTQRLDPSAPAIRPKGLAA